MIPTFPRLRSRRVALAIGLASAVLAFSPIARADDLPKFSNPDTNTFIKAYSDYTDQYVVAIKASKSGDNSKLMAMSSQSGDLQAKGAAMVGKLKPEEVKPYTDFMTKCAQKMSAAATAQ